MGVTAASGQDIVSAGEGGGGGSGWKVPDLSVLPGGQARTRARYALTLTSQVDRGARARSSCILTLTWTVHAAGCLINWPPEAVSAVIVIIIIIISVFTTLCCCLLYYDFQSLQYIVLCCIIIVIITTVYCCLLYCVCFAFS